MKPNEINEGHPPRVGLFGGTFNPIHRGHRQAALDVLHRFNLDRIYFIPCALPPHKATAPLASAQDRLEMVRMALDSHAKLMVSDVEIQRAGTSYSIDTVRHFKAILPKGALLIFIIGIDAFLEIDTWRAFNQLFDEVAFIVMSRPGDGLPTDGAQHHTIETHANGYIAAGYRFSASQVALVHPQKQTIHIAVVTPVDISSSQIRRMIQDGESTQAWLSPAVNHYIQQKGLYR